MQIYVLMELKFYRRQRSAQHQRGSEPSNAACPLIMARFWHAQHRQLLVYVHTNECPLRRIDLYNEAHLKSKLCSKLYGVRPSQRTRNHSSKSYEGVFFIFLLLFFHMEKPTAELFNRSWARNAKKERKEEALSEKLGTVSR